MDSLPVSGDGRLAIGAVDEPAHLATALLVLLAVGGPLLPLRHRVFFFSAAAGAVLIDLDHVPLYAGVPGIADPGGRPYSHSLVTPLVLGVLAWAIPRWRTVLRGLAVGTLLHFVRDIATGPGLPIWWPFSTADHLLPYAAYFSLLVVLAVVAAIRIYFQLLTPTAAAKGFVSDAE
jgi:inner membrane protein